MYFAYLCFVSAEEMDRNDEALRDTVKKLWPIQSKKMHALMIPPNEGINQSLNQSVCVSFNVNQLLVNVRNYRSKLFK